MDIKELLSRSMTCDKCQGQSLVNDDESTSGKKACEICMGSGIVLDNFVSDILLGLGCKGQELTEKAESIYNHYENKLMDAYERGVRDGKDIIVEKQNKEQQEVDANRKDTART